MTYDIESKLRAHLTNHNWDQRDIARVVSLCGIARANTLAAAKRVANRWSEEHTQEV
jgi:hypothetical protein